ncbi:MAG TPA: hypothetical protein VF338_03695, partial [Leptolinea sp.]
EMLSAYLDNALSKHEKALVDQRLSKESELLTAYKSLLKTRGILQSVPRVKRRRNFYLPPEMVRPSGWIRLIPIMNFGSAATALLAIILFIMQLSPTAQQPLQVNSIVVTSPALKDSAQPTLTAIHQQALGEISTPTPEIRTNRLQSSGANQDSALVTGESSATSEAVNAFSNDKIGIPTISENQPLAPKALAPQPPQPPQAAGQVPTARLKAVPAAAAPPSESAATLVVNSAIPLPAPTQPAAPTLAQEETSQSGGGAVPVFPSQEITGTQPTPAATVQFKKEPTRVLIVQPSPTTAFLPVVMKQEPIYRNNWIILLVVSILLGLSSFILGKNLR